MDYADLILKDKRGPETLAEGREHPNIRMLKMHDESLTISHGRICNKCEYSSWILGSSPDPNLSINIIRGHSVTLQLFFRIVNIVFS